MANQSFYNFIANQEYDVLKPLWNEYISETGNGEQIFDSVEDLADLGFEPLELARMVFFGNLQNWGDDVYLNGYGNVESCWSVEHSPISVSELTQWLEDSNHEFYQEWKYEQEDEEENEEE